MNPKRILVAMDNRGDANWGSQATTNGLFHLLARVYPDAEIRGVPRSVTRPKSASSRRLCELMSPWVVSTANWGGAAGRFVARSVTERWRADIGWADLIIINGEGTLHPQKQTTRWLAAIAALKKLTNAPVWISNATIDFLPGDRALIRSAFEGVSRIAVREPISFRQLGDHGFSPIQAADCALMTVPSSPEPARELVESAGIRGEYVVLTGSALIKNTNITTVRSIISLCASLGRKVLFTASAEEDIEFAQKLEIPVLTHKDASVEDLAGVLANADALVGGRFHPLLLSAMVGTPFIAFHSTTFKINGLLEALGGQNMLYDIADVDGHARALRAILDDRSRDGDPLKARAAELKKIVHLNVTDASNSATAGL